MVTGSCCESCRTPRVGFDLGPRDSVTVLPDDTQMGVWAVPNQSHLCGSVWCLGHGRALIGLTLGIV